MEYDLNDIVEMKKEHPCHKSKQWKIIRMGADGLVTDNPRLANFFLKFFSKNYLIDGLADLLYP